MAGEGDAERLVVLLEARIRDFERNMQKASGTARKSFKEIESGATRMKGALSSTMKAGAASLAAAFGVRELAAYADKWSEAGNKIAAAGEELDKVTARQSTLADLSIRSRSDFASVVDLYTGLTRSTQTLGASRAQVMAVTETIAKGFAVSGASASTAAGAITQLNQAMAAGALRGDELNSVLEGAPIIARLIADEFGVTVGQLKTLGEAGQLTSDRVFKAILNGRAKIEAEFGRTNATISQSFVNLDTAITRYIGIGDKASGTSAKIAAGIGMIGDHIDIVLPIVASLGAALAGLFVGGPWGAGIAGATTAVYLFSDALKPIAGDVATIGDYARVAFDLVKTVSAEAADALATAFAGVADTITAALTDSSGNVATVLENLLVGVKALGNAMIGAFSFVAQTITATWNNLGFAMAEAMVTAINTAIQAIQDGANAAVTAINAITGALNDKLGTAIGQIGTVELPQLTNAFQGAGFKAGDAYGSAFAALTKDYIGDTVDAAGKALGDIRDKANAIGAARTKAEGSAQPLADGSLSAPLSAPAAKGAGGGKGGGKSGSRKESEYERAVKQINEEIGAMQREQAAFGMSAEAAAKAEIAFRLLDAAKQSGIPITDELRAKVDTLASAYAAASTQLERTRDMQQTMEDLSSSLGKDTLKGFISDLRSGKSATEALTNALDRLLDKLTDLLLDAAFPTGGSGGGGGIAGLISSFLGRGGALGAPAAGGVYARGGVFDHGGVVPFAKGGVVTSPTFFPMAKGAGLMGEAGPEAVMPLRRLPGGRLGVEARGAGAKGGGPNVNVSVVSNMPNSRTDVQDKQDSSGNRNVDVVVNEAVANSISRRGGASSQALAGMGVVPRTRKLS